MKRVVFALLSLVLLSVRAQAGLVFEQTPDPGGQVLVSSWYPPDGTDYDNYVYDSFQLGSATAVTEVHWRGGYLYTGYGNVTDFTITFYESIAGGSQPHCGIPGDGDIFLAKYQVGGTAGQTPAGVFGGTQMYDYHYTLTTPFQAAANTKYWVQIEGSTAGLPFWGISVGNGGNNSHFEYSTGAHMFSNRSRDAAFSLYAADGQTFTITTSEAPAGSGTTTGGGTFAPGSTATVIATPFAGWGFTNWTENGNVVSQSPNYSFTVTANRNLVAHFVTAYAVSTSPWPVWGGSTSGDGVYNGGASVTVTATPGFGFDFVNWTEGGVPVSNSPNYTFTANNNRSLQANFALGAASVMYDFDTAEPPCYPGYGMPATQTSRGLTASFSAPAGAWSIQTDGTTQWHLSQFYANYLYPNSGGSTLAVSFDAPLTAIAIDFCTGDLHQTEIPTDVRLDAYTDASKTTLVGSAITHGTYGTDTFPMGTITFSSATPFRYVEMATVWQPQGTSYFWCDNLVVVRAPSSDVPTGTAALDFNLSGGPNPTSGPLALAIALPSAAAAKVTALDVNGREVRRIAEGDYAAGSARLDWDGKDDHGSPVPSGIYFVRLTAGRLARTMRVVITR